MSPTGWHFSFSASILLTKKILIICVRNTHFTLLAFTHTHLTIIFAPSSLKSCFSIGVSSVSGVSGVSGVSSVSGVSGVSSVSSVSGVSGASSALKKLAGWKSGAWLELF